MNLTQELLILAEDDVNDFKRHHESAFGRSPSGDQVKQFSGLSPEDKKEMLSKLKRKSGLSEGKKTNHLGERSFDTYAAWKKACKAINADVWFDGDADIAQALVGPKPYKRGETKGIGEWDGSTGSIYKSDAKVTEAKEVPGRGSLLKQVKAHAAKLLDTTEDKLKLIKDGAPKWDALDKATEASKSRKIFSAPGTKYAVAKHSANGEKVVRVDLEDTEAENGSSDTFFYTKKSIKEAIEDRINESEHLAKIAHEGDADKQRRKADKLEIGDPVEITGNVNFKEQTGEITRFGRDKKFVVVRLHGGGEHSFHSSDVSEAHLSDDYDSDEGKEHDKFYIAFYDTAEERSWIGVVSKEHGGKWHEKTYKGKPDHRWGQTYMSYLKPDDIMKWIHKDYHRGIEIEGPFTTSQEAEEHVEHNWGTLEEGFKKVSPQSQERVHQDRKDQRVKTPKGEGVIVDDRKVPTFSQMVPFKRTTRVKLDDGKTEEFDSKEVKPIKSEKKEVDESKKPKGEKKFDKARDKYEKSVSKDAKTPDYPERVTEDYQEDETAITGKFKTLMQHSKGKLKPKDTNQFQKMFDQARDKFAELFQKSNAEENAEKRSKFHIALDDALDMMKDVISQFKEFSSAKLAEEAFTNYSDWKASVLLSHPVQAPNIKFRGKMEGEKMTISAIVPGNDVVYGIWDDAIEVGQVITEAVSVRSIIEKLQKAVGAARYDVVYAHFIGGSAPGSDKFADKLEKSGYDTAGAWEENKEWFKKAGVSKAEFNQLVRAGQ